MTKTVNIVEPFLGSEEEMEANMATHEWWARDGETRCVNCDSRRYGRVAMWPCGEERRINVPVGSPEAAEAALGAVLAAATEWITTEMERKGNE